MAYKVGNGLDLQSQRIQNVLDPSSAQDAATKAYVDATAAGLDQKASVRAATTANITLSGTQTVDGVSLIAADRVLVKNQSTGADNGIYVVAAGSWSRAGDANASSEVTAGMLVIVEEGTVNGPAGSGGGNVFILTTANPITLGSTTLTFTRYQAGVTYTADGSGIELTGTTFGLELDGPTLSKSSSGLRIGSGAAGAGLTESSGVLAVGAGSGVTVNANDVAVDSTVARYYSTGTHSSGTSIVITHSLGRKPVATAVYITATDEQILTDVTATSTTQTTFTFAASQSANTLTFVIIG